MSGVVVEHSQSFQFKGKTYYRWPIMNGPSGSSTRISDKPFPAVCPCCGRDSTSQAAEIDALKHDIARYVEANTALMAERASLIETKREQIGALTKERDEAISKWEGADGMGGAVVHAIRELLNFHNVPISAFIDDHVANAIRQGNDAKRLLVEARAALEPFAKQAEYISDDVPDLKDLHGYTFQARDFRRARTLTNGGENGR